MIKNMQVRKSLVMGYGVTILIAAVIIISSLFMMNNQKNAYMNILNVPSRLRIFPSSRLPGYVRWSW